MKWSPNSLAGQSRPSVICPNYFSAPLPPTRLTVTPRFPKHVTSILHVSLVSCPVFPHLSPFPTSLRLSHPSRPCSTYFSSWNLLWSFQSESVSSSFEQTSTKFSLRRNHSVRCRLPWITLSCLRALLPLKHGRISFTFLLWKRDRPRFKVQFFRLLTL